MGYFPVSNESLVSYCCVCGKVDFHMEVTGAAGVLRNGSRRKESNKERLEEEVTGRE